MRWRNKFGGTGVVDARRLTDLESEDERLKCLITECREPPSIAQIRLRVGCMDDRSMADAARARMQVLDLTGPPYTIRTCDLRLRRPLLYPTELRAVGEKKTRLATDRIPRRAFEQLRQPRRQTQSPETKRARYETEPEIIPDHRATSREASDHRVKPAADAA